VRKEQKNFFLNAQRTDEFFFCVSKANKKENEYSSLQMKKENESLLCDYAQSRHYLRTSKLFEINFEF
jgi:hypothetical protein